MIISNLQNSSRVESLHPLFKKLFDYVKTHDLLHTPCGRIELEGDNLFINNVNPTCHLLCTILLEVAQMERGMIRTRMQMGYQEYLKKRRQDKEGHPLGRPSSYKKSDTQYREQYAKELSLLRKGISLRNVHKLTGTSIGTLRKLKQYL